MQVGEVEETIPILRQNVVLARMATESDVVLEGGVEGRKGLLIQSLQTE